MKTIILAAILGFVLVGCSTNDISSLSKAECIKQGFKYKIQKRFNYRNGEYEIKSICFNKNA